MSKTTTTVRVQDRPLLEGHVNGVRRETGCDNWLEGELAEYSSRSVVASWWFVRGYATAMGLTVEEMLAAFDISRDFATVYLKPGVLNDQLVHVLESKLEVEVSAVVGTNAVNIYNYNSDGAYKNLREVVLCAVEIIGIHKIEEVPSIGLKNSQWSK